MFPTGLSNGTEDDLDPEPPEDCSNTLFLFSPGVSYLLESLLRAGKRIGSRTTLGRLLVLDGACDSKGTGGKPEWTQ